MHGRRGFTLLEIMIALTVSAIALTAAIAAANAQQRAFYGSQKSRAAQNAGRSALLFLEQRLPRAGFGMDASLALDFGWFCPTCQPDRTDDADELVFYARDPAYWSPPQPEAAPAGHAWQLAATGSPVTAADVTLRARAGDLFRRGQILQAVCPGEPRYAYFTVAQTTPQDGVPLTAPTDLTVPLEPVATASPFHRQDVAVGGACFSLTASPARVFLIDRYRLYVRPVDVGGGRFDPFLVLDTGTDVDGDDDVDLDDEILIAEGIEAFQVSYQFTNAALLAGETPGTAIALNAGVAPAAAPATTLDEITLTTFPGGTPPPGQTDYAPSSFYGYRFTTPPPAVRSTNHQANVRAVRISLVARSPEPDPSASANLTWAPGSRLFRMNQNARPAWVPVDGGYQRTVLDSAVSLPNMTVRAMTYF